MEITTLWLNGWEVSSAETIEREAGTSIEAVANITSSFDDDCEEIKVLLDVDGGYPEEVLASTTGIIPNITTPSTYTIGNFEVLEGEHTYRVQVQCPAGDVSIVESFVFTIKQAPKCEFTSAVYVTLDLCNWLNNNPNPSQSEIEGKRTSYENKKEGCSGAVADRLNQHIGDLEDLYNGNTTISNLKSQYDCKCHFDSVEEVMNNFCGWLNNHSDPSDTEVNNKVTYYRKQHGVCTDESVKEKLANTCVTQLVSIYFSNNKSAKVDELVNQYCGGERVSITFESEPSASIYVDGNYKGTT